MNKYVIGVAVLIGLAVFRVASTYTVFNSTYDEPAHIAERIGTSIDLFYIPK